MFVESSDFYLRLGLLTYSVANGHFVNNFCAELADEFFFFFFFLIGQMWHQSRNIRFPSIS